MVWPALAAVGKFASSAGGGALLGGIGSGLLGGLFSNSANAMNNQAMTDISNANNAAAKDLANTQYQRSMADMRAAGLNPALMFGSAGPAPTPQLQAPALRATDFSAAAGQVSSAVMQSQALRQGQQTIDNNYLMQLEQMAKIKAEIANLPNATGMLELQKELTKAQTRLADFNSKPSNINELGTKLLQRFIDNLEKKYNSSSGAQGKFDFVSDMMSPLNKWGPFPMGHSPEF